MQYNDEDTVIGGHPVGMSPRRLSPKRETEEQRWVNRYANKGLPEGWAEQGSKCEND